MVNGRPYLQNFKHELAGPENAPKMVFLHGVMGSGANWRKIIPAFQKDFRILTYDQRGHGWSFKPSSGYSPEDYAEDLRRILDELGWGQVILIGHSMGGRNALHFAQKFPERVEALVIEDIGPEGNPKAMQKTIDMVEMVPVPFQSKIAAKEYFNHDFVEKMSHNPKADILGQYLYTNIEQQADGRANWRFSKDAILTSLMEGHFKPNWQAVRDFAMPVLFIRGEHSDDFPKDEYLKVLDINPRVKGVEIANSGHWVHFDQPKAFIDAIKHFLHDSLGF